MVIHKPEVDQSKSLSGMRVLIAVVVGFAIAAAVAFFLKVLIDNSPAEIDLRRLRLFYLMVITSGGLSGLAIETIGNCRSRRPILDIANPIPTAVVFVANRASS